MDLRYLLAYFFSFLVVAAQPTKYVFKGQRVNFNPDLSGRSDEILWKHNGNKVIEFTGNEEVVFPAYEDRITLDWHSAAVSISNLRYEDSGDYELEVYVNGKLYQSHHKMEVIDTVPKPTISCQMSNDSRTDILATLLCSAESKRPPSLMKFEWTSRGIVEHGPRLTISLGGNHDDEVYNCTVSNPLSSESATFTAKDCLDATDSAAALVVPVVIALLLALVLAAVGIIILKCRNKACFVKQQKDVEKQSNRGGTKESNSETPEFGRTRSEASTLRSTQPLGSYVQGNMAEMKRKYESIRGGQISPEKKMGSEEEDERSHLLVHEEDSEDDAALKGVEDKPENAESPSAPRSDSKSPLESSTAAEGAGPEENVESPSAPRSDSPPAERDSDVMSTILNEEPKSPLESSTAAEDAGVEDKPENAEAPRSDSPPAERDSDGMSTSFNEEPKSPLESSTAAEDAVHEEDSEDDAALKELEENVESPSAPRSDSPPAERDSDGMSTILNEEPKSPLESSTAAEDAGVEGKPENAEAPSAPRSDSPPAERDSDGMSTSFNEEPKSPLESSTAAEDAALEKEPEEEEEEEEANSLAAKDASIQNSVNMAGKDTAGEHKEEANVNQVNGEPTEDRGEEKTNEPDLPSEDDQSSTIPEAAHEANLSQGEADKHEEPTMDKPISEAHNDSDKEEINQKMDLYSDPTEQRPDIKNTGEDLRDTLHEDPDKEADAKIRNDSEERSEDKGETAVGKNEVRSSHREENQASEDEEEQRKDEVVA